MKLTAHLPHGTVTVIAILAGAFLIYQSGALNKAVSLAENAANKNSDDVLHAKKSFQAQIATKDIKISAESSKVAYLTWSISQLKVQNKHLLASLDSAKTPQDTINAQSKIIVNITSQNDSLTHKCAVQDTVISTCKEEKQAMQARIDTLTTTLGNQVESTKCSILFFGCPSRVASFEVGTGIGALIILILKSVVH